LNIFKQNHLTDLPPVWLCVQAYVKCVHELS